MTADIRTRVNELIQAQDNVSHLVETVPPLSSVGQDDWTRHQDALLRARGRRTRISNEIVDYVIHLEESVKRLEYELDAVKEIYCEEVYE